MTALGGSGDSMSHREQALEFVRRFAAGDVDGLEPLRQPLCTCPPHLRSFGSDLRCGEIVLKVVISLDRDICGYPIDPASVHGAGRVFPFGFTRTPNSCAVAVAASISVETMSPT